MTGLGAVPDVEAGLAAPDAGPRVLAPFGRRRCRVQINEAVGPYRLVGAEDADGPTPLPGQFYMLAAVSGWGGGEGQRPYLARAFSVCRVRENRLDFLVDDVGPGTSRLTLLEEGDHLWLVGPLGVGFSSPAELSSAGEQARALLVGGGIGIAPLVILEEELARSGIAFRTLLGVRSARYRDATTLFGGPVELATDDGSAGHPGLVTDLLERELEEPGNVVFACGPPMMLEAVRSICAARSVPAQFAMEEVMACGFGACNGCVVETTTGYRRLCVDGPVVSAADLDEGWLRE